MAPPRRHVSDLGEALRAARKAAHVDQLGLAQRIPVSARLVSRWENGTRPSPDQAQRIFDVLSAAPGPLLVTLADALGIELPEVEETLAPPPRPAAPLSPAVLPPPPRPTAAELRAAFNAVIYAAAEERDLLPRHLRPVAVELFQVAHRLGVDAKDAALLVAMPERADREQSGSSS